METQSEKTIMYVEPEVWQNKSDSECIMKRVSQIGCVTFSRDVKLDAFMIQLLSPELAPHLMRVRVQHLYHKHAQVLVINGDSVIANVSLAVGLHSDPDECDERSLRYHFSRSRLSKVLGDGKFYSPKYLDAPKTQREVMEWSKIFFNGSHEQVMNS